MVAAHSVIQERASELHSLWPPPLPDAAEGEEKSRERATIEEVVAVRGHTLASFEPSHRFNSWS